MTIHTNDFRFVEALESMQIIPEAGTLIAYDGAEAVTTPYENCVIVMPAPERYRLPGMTAVRLGQLLDLITGKLHHDQELQGFLVRPAVSWLWPGPLSPLHGTIRLALRREWGRVISRWCWPAYAGDPWAPRGRPLNAVPAKAKNEPFAMKSLLLVLGATVLYGLLVREAGFIALTFACVLISARASTHKRWFPQIILAIGTSCAAR